MSEVGIAIFVKTPALSPVKSRLWPRLGRAGAEAFHFASARAVASVVERACANAAMVPWWAVAEPASAEHAVWDGFPHLHQGPGSLGERMRCIYSALCDRHGAAVLIGADAPQLTAAELRRAAAWLREGGPRLVMGGADDGGFWLFGGNVELPAAAWTAVAYSQANTAQEFEQHMRPHGEWLSLQPLTDADHYEDLSRVRDDLLALDDPTDAQRSLAEWIRCAAAAPEART